MDISSDLARGIANRMRKLRLEENLTQEGLASRAGITLSSLKRFEHTAEISLDRLIRIGLVLGAASQFAELFRPEVAMTLDELIAANTPRRRRGRRQ
jgi:transcriptional regulator with XRE-family HTH domain